MTETTTADQDKAAAEDAQPERRPLYRDPYYLAGAAAVVVFVMWMSQRKPARRAEVVAFPPQPCADCAKRRAQESAGGSVNGHRPAAAVDDEHPVPAAVDPQEIVEPQSANGGLDELGVEIPADLR